jgi:hypothetical protein
MKIEIDTDLLEQLEISADEFLFLESLRTGQGIGMAITRLTCDLDRLEQQGYIKILEGEEEQPVVLRQEYLDAVQSDFDAMFAELVGEYPFKVGNVGQQRVLRAHDPKAKANDTARNRYKKAVGTDVVLHRKAIAALHVQLESMRSKLQYMPALEVWINKREWEKWEDMEQSEDGAVGISEVL